MKVKMTLMGLRLLWMYFYLTRHVQLHPFDIAINGFTAFTDILLSKPLGWLYCRLPTLGWTSSLWHSEITLCQHQSLNITRVPPFTCTWTNLFTFTLRALGRNHIVSTSISDHHKSHSYSCCYFVSLCVILCNCVSLCVIVCLEMSRLAQWYLGLHNDT